LADLVEIEQWPEYNGAKFMPTECRQPSGQPEFFASYLSENPLSRSDQLSIQDAVSDISLLP
jgi:hypothetical protein